jgi:hypothetical protein
MDVGAVLPLRAGKRRGVRNTVNTPTFLKWHEHAPTDEFYVRYFQKRAERGQNAGMFAVVLFRLFAKTIHV